MRETYVVRFFIGDDNVASATVFNYDNVKNIIKDYDIKMAESGKYRRVSYLKTRVDKRHLTNIKVVYVRV